MSTKELAGKNIGANAICPGFIETEMTANLEEKERAPTQKSARSSQ